MIELGFLVCWTLGFAGMGRIIWKRFVRRGRLYVMLALNLVFLAGLFAVYPLVLERMVSG